MKLYPKRKVVEEFPRQRRETEYVRAGVTWLVKLDCGHETYRSRRGQKTATCMRCEPVSH